MAIGRKRLVLRGSNWFPFYVRFSFTAKLNKYPRFSYFVGFHIKSWTYHLIFWEVHMVCTCFVKVFFFTRARDAANGALGYGSQHECEMNEIHLKNSCRIPRMPSRNRNRRSIPGIFEMGLSRPCLLSPRVLLPKKFISRTFRENVWRESYINRVRCSALRGSLSPLKSTRIYSVILRPRRREESDRGHLSPPPGEGKSASVRCRREIGPGQKGK